MNAFEERLKNIPLVERGIIIDQMDTLEIVLLWNRCNNDVLDSQTMAILTNNIVSKIYEIKDKIIL